MAPDAWWFTQCKVVLIYLKLAIWPSPLLCSYELPYLKTFSEAWIYVIPVLILAIVALVLLWRNKPAGFLLAFVAAILAPTFVVPVVTEMAAERRMYLPLAAIFAPLVVAVYIFAEGKGKSIAGAGTTARDTGSPRYAVLLSVPILALIYGIASAKRLGDYYDETSMWEQVVQAQPSNFVAHYNLGLMYNYAGRHEESMEELQASVAANPDYANARSAYGFALHQRRPAARGDRITQGRTRDRARLCAVSTIWDIALTRLGSLSRGDRKFGARNTRRSDLHSGTHQSWQCDCDAGRPVEATQALQGAEQLAADDPDALYDVANALSTNNLTPKAIELLERAVKLRPDFAAAHNRLGIALAQSGDPTRALVDLRRQMQLDPSDYQLLPLWSERGSSAGRLQSGRATI